MVWWDLSQIVEASHLMTLWEKHPKYMVQAGSTVLPAPDWKPTRWVESGLGHDWWKPLTGEVEHLWRGDNGWALKGSTNQVLVQAVSHELHIFPAWGWWLNCGSTERKGMQLARCVACTEQKREWGKNASSKARSGIGGKGNRTVSECHCGGENRERPMRDSCSTSVHDQSSQNSCSLVSLRSASLIMERLYPVWGLTMATCHNLLCSAWYTRSDFCSKGAPEEQKGCCCRLVQKLAIICISS